MKVVKYIDDPIYAALADREVFAVELEAEDGFSPVRIEKIGGEGRYGITGGASRGSQTSVTSIKAAIDTARGPYYRAVE